MPWAAPRTCAEPGCPRLATGGPRCPWHAKAHRHALDQGRPGPRQRGYDAAWERRRAAHLAAHPRCVRCGAIATDVDHVTAKRDGGTDDPSNLRSFCHACHSSRTGRDQGGFRRRGHSRD